MKAVISYAHTDRPMLKEIHKHLAMLRREGKLTDWHDHDILAGSSLDNEISEHIRSCDLFIPLVSPDFLASNYCYETETKLAIALHKAGRLRIIPIIIEPCEWQASPLKEFKALPLDGKPVSEWQNANTALYNVATELRRVIEAHQHRMSFGSAPPTSAKSTAAAVPLLRSLRSGHRQPLPLVTFADKIDRFMCRSVLHESWARLDPDIKRLVTTLGTKLEPIVQIAPVTASPVVLGFECLALGPHGESFGEISARCASFDALRICLAVGALEAVHYLRSEAAADVDGVADLQFSLNLDPTMLDSPLLRPFLRHYRLPIQHNVIFEINEATTARYLMQLKTLQVDFKLRYSADDVNAWDSDVWQQMTGRVEMTKMDHRSFGKAMADRGEAPAATIKALRANSVSDKPLVVEGVDDADYLEFLRRHWDAKRFGELYAQGYYLEPGVYWNREILSLKDFGLPGGCILRRRSHGLGMDVSNDIDSVIGEGAGITLQ